MLFYPEVARQIRTAQPGRLILAGHPRATITVLPALMTGLLVEQPGVHVKLLSCNSDVIGQLLPSESYAIDIAELPSDDAVVRLSRFHVRCVAILPSAHPLACYPTPAFAVARTLQTSARVAAAFAQDGAERSPVVEPGYFASVCSLVASGADRFVIDPLSQAPFGTWVSSPLPFDPGTYCETVPARPRAVDFNARLFLSPL